MNLTEAWVNFGKEWVNLTEAWVNVKIWRGSV